MTIKELIAQLSQYDLSLQIFVNGYEGGIQSPKIVKEIQAFFIGPRSYMGDHDEFERDWIDDDWLDGKQLFKAVLIGR